VVPQLVETVVSKGDLAQREQPILVAAAVAVGIVALMVDLAL